MALHWVVLADSNLTCLCYCGGSAVDVHNVQLLEGAKRLSLSTAPHPYEPTCWLPESIPEKFI